MIIGFPYIINESSKFSRKSIPIHFNIVEQSTCLKYKQIFAAHIQKSYWKEKICRKFVQQYKNQIIELFFFLWKHIWKLTLPMLMATNCNFLLNRNIVIYTIDITHFFRFFWRKIPLINVSKRFIFTYQEWVNIYSIDTMFFIK